MKSVESNFYCLVCGRPGIPLQRRASLQRAKGHRKKLYCVWCQKECNHIECKTQEEIDAFREKYEKGEYEKEAYASLEYCGRAPLARA